MTAHDQQKGRMEELRNEFLGELAERVATFLAEYNIDPKVAQHCGLDLANFLADDWGGQHVTFPKDYHFKIAQRNLEIWHDYTGYNHRELAKKYELSENAIYRIIRQVRSQVQSSSQDDFFSG